MGQGYLHTSGAQILDENNQPVRIAGVSWFGFETETYTVHGLDERSYKEMLDHIKRLHYNTIRLPFSTQMFDPASEPVGIDYTLNPELKNLDSQQILDKIVDYAGEIELRIILDRHRIVSTEQSSLWYNEQYPETRWLEDWQKLAERYRDNPTVIGADLHNEPREQACWGCGDEQIDWRLAAQRAGNAILALNPQWLIFVQGVECYGTGGTTAGGDCYWWGGNLKGVKTAPVELSVSNRLVYAVHDYGPSIHSHTWFNEQSFPANMPDVWNAYWGYIQKEGIAPVWVGEFGSRLQQENDHRWLDSLVNYLGTGINGINWTFWSWNPDSVDTGGILQDDWQTVNQEKQDILQAILPPYNQESNVSVSPTPQSQQTAIVASGDLQLVYKNGNPGDPGKIAPQFKLTNSSDASIELSEVRIRYWFTSETDKISGQQFWCDFAEVDCSTITGSVVPITPARQQADAYLEVTFIAGTLEAGKDTGEIKVRTNKSDWSPYDEKNDYSYGSAASDYAASTKVTVYYQGALVWGVEPV
jgi:endoglucanase